MKRWLMILVVAAAACSSGGEKAATPATEPSATSPQPSTTAGMAPLTVRVVIATSGSGCAGDNPISGTGSRVTVKDGAGAVVGTGTFALTPGADVCDWQARVPLSASPDFLTIVGDVRELTTVSRSDYEDGGVVITITAGDVRVS